MCVCASVSPDGRRNGRRDFPTATTHSVINALHSIYFTVIQLEKGIWREALITIVNVHVQIIPTGRFIMCNIFFFFWIRLKIHNWWGVCRGPVGRLAYDFGHAILKGIRHDVTGYEDLTSAGGILTDITLFHNHPPKQLCICIADNYPTRANNHPQRPIN